ncbi:MAG: hypothetical protein QXF44_00595, partial [Candidatus Bathyarchaeia archaeon]
MIADQTPKILFKCPRCSEEIVMAPTAQNYWRVLNEEHNEKCLIFEVAGPFEYFVYLPQGLHKFILALRPPLIFARVDTESMLSAEIKMHESMLRRAKTEEEMEFLNKIISYYKFRKQKGEEYLNYALEVLKHGSFGLRIRMFLPVSESQRDAFLWKYVDRYFGAVDFYSPDALLNSSSFKDAENFAKKWFSYAWIPEGEQSNEEERLNEYEAK